MIETEPTLQAAIQLPPIKTLERLAVSERGFVFDPTSGDHFTLNETGLVVIRALQQNKTLEDVIESLRQEYNVEPQVLERDLLEFSGMINSLLDN
ncbi:MAG: PqqD family protein [Pseudomonadales bacterium]|nr:PqqD family protein [Pseudomonadales bacterium]